jgi:fatty-acyl-CoA synthase
MPFFHAGGSLLGLGPVHVRGTHVALHTFDPALFLELIETEGGDIAVGVPTMVIALMEQPDIATRDTSKLRVVGSGGSSVPAELVRNVESTLDVHFAIVFGQTECMGIATGVAPEDSTEDKYETVGRALPQTEIKVIDPESAEIVAPGVLGEICIRGYNVMTGYFDMPDATAAAIDADGWLHTGDLGTMDDRGFIRIQGRLKDMIIRGGENIYPREIEAVLFEHPAVGDVAVTGVPDDRWGEQVAAFVRLAPGAKCTEQELFALVREKLAHYKSPRHWRFVGEFPLTPSGKIQKFVLREKWEKGEFDAPS